MRHERSVIFPTHDECLTPRNDQQTAVRQPIDTKGKTKWRPNDHLAVAIKANRNDLLSAPVRKPQSVFMPPWRLTHRNTCHQRPHSWCLSPVWHHSLLNIKPTRANHVCRGHDDV